jgi:hypothetical protein
MFNTIEDVERDAFGGGRIIRGNMGAQGYEVVDAFGRPLELHTLFGDERSLRVSQEASHLLTRVCTIPLPRSSEAIARSIPAACHSFTSRYS